MIELGILKIMNIDSIIEARKKIRGLVTSFGYTDIKTTRIEVAISEICRRCYCNNKDILISIFITDIYEKKALLFKLSKIVTKENLEFGNEIFDNYFIRKLEDNSLIIEAFSYIKDMKFSISKEEIEELKKVLSIPSRQELMVELKKKNDKLLVQAEELRDAKERAEEAAKTKSDFLANMSHEIRTPINAIMGMTYLIEKTDLNTKQRDYINKISQSNQHLLGVINDILDFSKIEAGKLKIEKTSFKLAEVLDNLENLIGDKCASKGLQLIFDLDTELPKNLCGDPLRVGQILINYVSNAVKFTEKGQIVVRIRKEEELLDQCVIKFEVQDTGLGMTEEQKGELFQSFQQADTSITRKYGGTGLGLAISKELATLMEGQVGVETELGIGSTFWFTAKLGIGKATQKMDEPLKNNESLTVISGARILLVEDNELNVQVAVDLLQEGEFSIDFAKNGKIAVDKVRENKYDIVLMDMQMPVMDGVTATKEIRRNIKRLALPIIAMTANVMTNDQNKCIQAGMNDYISKPIDPNQLFSILLKWIPFRKVSTEKVKFKASVNTCSDDFVVGIPGLDTSLGLRRVLGKKKSYINLLKKYVLGQKDAIMQIEKVISEGDFLTAERIAHTLKGVSGTIGAVVIQEKAASLEEAIKKRISSDILNTMLRETSVMLSKMIKALESVLPEDEQVAMVTGNVSSKNEILKIMNELKPYLKTRKPKKCAEVMKEYRKLVWPVEIQKNAAEIERFVLKYKFKEALDILEVLMNNLKGEEI